MFSISEQPIDLNSLRETTRDPAAGGYASFEGWVRNHHEGKDVTALEYEAFAPLAIKEGNRIIAEATERFAVHHCAAIHRVGHLSIGDIAIAISVSASHRDAAFDACRYIIDEVKSRVPIWKKEWYPDGSHTWVKCHHCAKHD